MVGFKTIFLEKLEPDIKNGAIKSILDLGSGLSLNFLPLLKKFPELTYVGVEPSKEHAKQARLTLAGFKNAKIYNADGYVSSGDKWGTFDLVISFSVLEHIKQLEKFLKNSIAAARPGGLVVHCWDLGHALHPSSFKERLQVGLGNHLPAVLPEHKFVRMLFPSEASRLMERYGLKIEKISYHQMYCHKAFLNLLDQSETEAENLARELIEWEFKAFSLINGMKEEERLRLFPTVAMVARKI